MQSTPAGQGLRADGAQDAAARGRFPVEPAVREIGGVGTLLMGSHTVLALGQDGMEARLVASLRLAMSRSMQLLADVIDGDAAPAEVRRVRAQVEKHAAALSEAEDPDTVIRLADLSFKRLEAVIVSARERNHETRADLARALAIVRETIALLAPDADALVTEMSGSAERIEAIVRSNDLRFIRQQLTGEVERLRQVASERRANWARTTAALETRVLALEEALTVVREEASTDVLTGLCNRRGFEQALAAHLASPSARLALAIVDVDDLKRVNDAHGHAVGDRLLQQVAATLKTGVRDADLVARIGGDEFAIVASGASLAEAEPRLRSIVQALAATIVHAGGPVTVSCGIVELTAGDSLRTLGDRADRALYEAKRLGKNRVVSQSPPYIRDLRRP